MVPIDKLNYDIQLDHSKKIVTNALAHCEHPIVSTKFGPDSAIFLHFITNIIPNIPIIWVDTGYNTRATTQFVDSLSQRLSLNLQRFEPENHTIIIPPELDDPKHAEFSLEVKIRPFQKALQTLKADAWFSSIRREQTEHRRQLNSFELTNHDILKISPLLNWNDTQLQQYRDMYQLPVGPECFDPTKGLPFRECGLHTSVAY